MREHTGRIFRVSVIMLSLIMMLSVIPLMGEHAYAEADGEEIGVKDLKLPDKAVKAAEKKAKEEAFRHGGTVEEKTGENIEEYFDIQEEADENAKELIEVSDHGSQSLITPARLDSFSARRSLKEAIDPTDFGMSVSDPDENGQALVQAYIEDAGFSFNSIYVDDEKVGDLSGQEVNGYLDMKMFEVGYHIVKLTFDYNGEETGRCMYVDMVPSYIYGKPSNNIRWYTAGINYLALYYGGADYDYDPDCDVYMYYKNGKKDWTQENYGPVSTDSYNLSKKSGFRSNSTVKVRLVYGKKVTYNGQSYLFTGRTTGNYSSAVTVKTAYSKPKVKSIYISKVKVKVHRWKVRYATRIYYIKSTGRIIKRVPLYHHYKSSKTKFVVNVTFSKKQGIKGIYIKAKGMTKLRKGDKKKYSATFTVSGNKKGKKTVVSVRSYRSSIYGGYSKVLKKKVKIK